MKGRNFRKPVRQGKPGNNAGREINPAIERFERAATAVGVLGREELKTQIKSFKGRFKLDFSEEYLNGCSVDKLRHILLAALINASKPK